MIRMLSCGTGWICGLFLALGSGAAFAETSVIDMIPVLEKYSLSQGANTSGSGGRGIKINLVDRNFGGSATARAQVAFDTSDRGSTLSMKVYRNVPRGHLAFALLSQGVSIVGYVGDNAVYSRMLANGPGFGDSASGHWKTRLQDLPANLERIEISFFGNYE